MKIRVKGKRETIERNDVVHVVPISNPEKAGVKFRNGTSMFIKWTDILKIEND